MSSNGTTLGGSQEAFPDTTAGVVGGFARGPEGLDELCRRYWKPVYAYVRAAWAKSNEDAKDLTQAFFLWLMEQDALARYDPGRGRLRAYLKTLLRRFVGHKEAAMNRLKRGGGVRVFSIDDSRAPELSGAGSDPDQLFDRAWVLEVVGAAVERVKARCASGASLLAFQVYEAYALVPEPERPAYADLARRFDLGVGQVKQLIFDVRQRLRREVRAELARGTGSPRELEEEWHELFGR
jgi:RNA polymerase sigma-70 factor (ECF subfamily)